MKPAKSGLVSRPASLAWRAVQCKVWLALLWPLLWLQARHVRRVSPAFPDPPGQRLGTTGSGTALRLLVAGDSGAAAVGVATQGEGLCGQLVQALSLHHTVHWCVQASNGLDSPGLMALLQAMPGDRYDVVVLSMGANDATALHTPGHWALWQNEVAELIEQRFQPCMLIHSAVPPMHACRALPQPLRWFMGLWAVQMNHALASCLHQPSLRSMHWHPEQMLKTGMSADLIHPNAEGYAAWSATLLPHILAAATAAVPAPPATPAA